jgi:ribosomal protein L31E
MNRMERWNRTFWHRGAHNAPRHVQIRVQALSDLIGDCQEVTYAVCSQMFQ